MSIFLEKATLLTRKLKSPQKILKKTEYIKFRSLIDSNLALLLNNFSSQIKPFAFSE